MKEKYDNDKEMKKKTQEKEENELICWEIRKISYF